VKRSRFALAATAAVTAPALAVAQPAPVVRFAAGTVESYALANYAKDQGFFARNGVAVELQNFAGSGPITSGVVGGAFDVGCASLGSLSNAHLHAIPVQLIAPGGLYASSSPTTLLVVAKNSPIATAADLNGKTVGVSVLKDIQAASVLKWVDANGGDSGTIRFVELGATEMVPALSTGRIAASTLVEPSLTYGKNDVRILGACYDAIAKNLLISMHFALAPWLEQNAATARRLIAALRATAQWANANRAAAGAILERISKVPAATIAEMHRTVYGEALDPATIQPVIDALAQYRYIEGRYPASELLWTGR
jgi:NitT/TauT family transport system substrate-binding protein